jgi:serine protease
MNAILAAALAATLLAASFGAPASSVHATEPAPTADRPDVPKAPPTKPIVHVKFREGTEIRLRGGKLVSLGGVDTSALDAALGKHPKLRVEPLFLGGEAALDRKREAAERRSGDALADFNLWYRLTAPSDADRDALVRALRDLPVVESAQAAFLPLPTATPSYTGKQGYALAAPTGINAAAAKALAGGTGDRVRIIDLEYGYNRTHEDLGNVVFIPNGTPTDPFNDPHHGTATLGVLAATANGFGVTGIVPGATTMFINVHNAERGYDGVNALMMAVDRLSAGDLLLIEQQTSEYMPMEDDPEWFDAIKYATSRGIIVIEPAGNGTNDLDQWWPGHPESGAIIVGAGEAANVEYPYPARSRSWFSNYGARVDVQGWGEGVMTTGYGNLYNGGPNAQYTAGFSGTSSASPIVAGAAAIVASVYEARFGRPATPAQVRGILKATGSPQVTGGETLPGHIGPLPDVARALATFEEKTAPVVSGPYNITATDGVLSTTGAVPTQVSWSAKDPSAIGAYEVRMSVDGGSWRTLALPSPTTWRKVWNLSPGKRYRFSVRAMDMVGNWSAWKDGTSFTLSLASETSTAITWSSGWTRAAYASGLGGYTRITGTNGATAKLTFTGSHVAWVGVRGTNRGQADVYLDGVFQMRVDPWAEATAARSVLFSKNVKAGVSHTLLIKFYKPWTGRYLDVDGFVIAK